MNKALYAFLGFFCLGAVGLVAYGVISSDSSNEGQDETVDVIVSILPQKEFVQAVGGDKVTVQELIRPGESPETYSLTANDLVEVENADIYFRIGYIPFENANIESIQETNTDLKIVQIPSSVVVRTFTENEEHSHDHEEEEVHNGGHKEDMLEDKDAHDEETNSTEKEHRDNEDSEVHKDKEDYDNTGETSVHEDENHKEDVFEHEEDTHADDHEHEENEIDPHIWLSISNMKLHVDSIAQELGEIDPDNANFYLQNAEEYKGKLDELDNEIAENLLSLENVNLLVFHPAWGYFADEYGLEQIAIEQDGNNPTAGQISELIAIAREREIGVVFVQEQFSTDAAESIANELSIPVVQINPLAEDYIENMREMSVVISENL